MMKTEIELTFHVFKVCSILLILKSRMNVRRSLVSKQSLYDPFGTLTSKICTHNTQNVVRLLKI